MVRGATYIHTHIPMYEMYAVGRGHCRYMMYMYIQLNYSVIQAILLQFTVYSLQFTAMHIDNGLVVSGRASSNPSVNSQASSLKAEG